MWSQNKNSPTYIEIFLKIYTGKNEKQKFNPKRPDAVWFTDITYIWTSEGFMFLSTIMDLFSHKIIAWELSRTMEEKFVIDSRLRLLSEPCF